MKYSARFWGQGVWQPRTDVYQYTGWNIVDEINKREPRKVLDVGCGYNQFKPRIPNLIGIDKFNNSADYMVDILDFNVEPESFDAVIVFGSINFGDWDDMSIRYKKVFELLAPGGRVYVRANPGHSHKNGPWIDIFPWSFEHAHNIAKENNVELVQFKQDNGERLFFMFEKG
jgi:SAM-dependent methyltransferase